MNREYLPTYEVPDDYRDNGRLFVLVRWFLIGVWGVLHNYRPTLDEDYWVLNFLVLLLAALNGYVHWRIATGRSVSRRYMVSISAADLALITFEVAATNAFQNNFFVLYYPALLGLSLVALSWRFSLAATAVVTSVYTVMSFLLPGSPDIFMGEEKVLAIRVATMFAVVAVGNLLIGVERRRRREAVERNLELQKRAQEAARAAELREANERLEAELAERKRAEEALERRGAELTAANAELEAFSYSVSHDLRSPLRSIDGFSQALLEDYGERLDADWVDYLKRVRAGSQRMGDLIDDMLSLSRVTRSEMRREKVDLGALARAVANELEERQPERQVNFVLPEELTANGDARLLRLALENLLGNAWKFTGKQPEATIEFGVTRRDGTPEYFVRDDGTGFDMAYADKLFGAFQRLHTTEEFEGTGVGLATVRRVVRSHGGRIWADAEEGKGATFYFTLG